MINSDVQNFMYFYFYMLRPLTFTVATFGLGVWILSEDVGLFLRYATFIVASILLLQNLFGLRPVRRGVVHMLCEGNCWLVNSVVTGTVTVLLVSVLSSADVLGTSPVGLAIAALAVAVPLYMALSNIFRTKPKAKTAGLVLGGAVAAIASVILIASLVYVGNIGGGRPYVAALSYIAEMALARIAYQAPSSGEQDKDYDAIQTHGGLDVLVGTKHLASASEIASYLKTIPGVTHAVVNVSKPRSYQQDKAAWKSRWSCGVTYRYYGMPGTTSFVGQVDPPSLNAACDAAFIDLKKSISYMQEKYPWGLIEDYFASQNSK